MKTEVAICKHCHSYIAFLNIFNENWSWYHIKVNDTVCSYVNDNIVAEPEEE